MSWIRVRGIAFPEAERGLYRRLFRQQQSEQEEEAGRTFVGEKKKKRPRGGATRDGKKPDQFIY